MYQNCGNENTVADLIKLINNVKDYTETLDTEFIKFKLLNVSTNN